MANSNFKPKLISDVRSTKEYEFLKETDEFIRLLFSSQEKDEDDVIQKTIDYLKAHPTQTCFLVKLLSYFTSVRPKQWKFITKVYRTLLAQFPDQASEIIHLSTGSVLFYQLLSSQGIVESREGVSNMPKVNPIIITVYSPDSLCYYIKEDELENFQNYLSKNPTFNINQKIPSPQYTAPFYVCFELSIDLLSLSAFYGSLQIFKYLIEQNVQITKRCSLYAVAGGHSDIINILKEKGVSFSDCFYTSVQYHRYELSDLIITKYGQQKMPLCDTIYFYHYEAFLYSLLNGSDPNEENKNHLTPIQISCESGNLPLVKLLFNYVTLQQDEKEFLLHMTAKEGDLQIMKYLIEELKINKEAKDVEDWTTLHIACHYGNLQVIKYLVEEQKVNINAKNKYHEIPFHFSCGYGDLEVVKYLYDKGADINAVEDRGYPSAFFAVQNGKLNILQYLIEKGFDIYYSSNDKVTILHVSARKSFPCLKYLIESCNGDLNLKDIDGKGLLHFACLGGNLENVKYLIEVHKFNKEEKTNEQLTPLHFACIGGNFDVVKYLMELPVDKEAKDKWGWTPFFFACQNGNLDVVKYMIDNQNVMYNITDADGIKPIMVAVQFKKFEVAEYISRKANPNRNGLGLLASLGIF
ncbi:ankyrin repeat protein [Histomonas meleagridis]|uniref:ankyrin repeat protein n=1 Tax=Histomonas meleagridis TaxID=135588 RepID=UPI00355A5C60|nr:ankyrin repeat protein [Histomonas meleagridis]KAH0800025.1 ankyrin repeat protein [Histomonas meleagridis]